MANNEIENICAQHGSPMPAATARAIEEHIAQRLASALREVSSIALRTDIALYTTLEQTFVHVIEESFDAIRQMVIPHEQRLALKLLAQRLVAVAAAFVLSQRTVDAIVEDAEGQDLPPLKSQIERAVDIIVRRMCRR